MEIEDDYRRLLAQFAREVGDGLVGIGEVHPREARLAEELQDRDLGGRASRAGSVDPPAGAGETL